jgi:protein involved in polysaccharide export with SLBB domain
MRPYIYIFISTHLPIFAFTLLLFTTTGCVHTQNFIQKDYIIHRGDTLRVVIFKEYDEKAIVRPDYKISLPLIGEVSCRYKTPRQLSQELSQRFGKEAVVMIEETQNFKFKDFVSFIRDVSWFYFLGKRIAK